MNPLIPGLAANVGIFSFQFTREIAEILGKEVGKDIAQVSDKIKDAISAWLEGYIEAENEVSPRHFKLQDDLNKRLLPAEDILNNSFVEGEYAEFVNTEKDRSQKDIADNRADGDRRESEFKNELEQQYDANDGYTIKSEVYLRDKDGNIVKDPFTGEARRVDFVVTKDGKVIKSYEVTSPTAPKEDQMAKEARIRENGGNYIKDEETGELISYYDNVKTEVVRLA